MIDHGGQGGGGAPDLVAPLDGELVIDVALGERLGGARERAPGGAWVTGEGEGQSEREEQGERADDQCQARGTGLGVGKALVGRRALAVGAAM